MPEPQPRRAPSSSPAGRVVAAAFRKAAGTNGNGQASRAVPAPLLEKRRKRAKDRLREALDARGTEAVPAALRTKVEGLVARWAAKEWSEGFEEIAELEVECFAEGELARAQQSGDEGRVFAVLEGKHRAEVVKEYGKIEIRGLQMSARVFQDLDLAYVPLRIEDASDKGQVIKAGEGIEIRTVPRLSVPALLAKHERAVIVGAPGSGKTTIVAWVAAMAAMGKLHAETGWKESPVPFVVPVRSLKGERLDAEAIAAVSWGASADFVKRVLHERRGLVLVDGLDEAHGGAEALVPVLTRFAKAYPGNRILVTTRPAGPAGSERVEVPGFASTTLQPMSREEVYVFIERWCLAAEVSIQKERARAEEEAKRAADDLKSRVQNSRPVERLAQTPLICSVLCIVHRFLGQRIPERRAALYDACTNVLLYEWDRAKFSDGSAVGELDAQDKKFLLGGIARRMHEARVAEISAADLIAGFAERLPLLRRSADEADKIVREIQFRSGLLIERRPGMFAFSHLTFQEYLAAVEIVRAGDVSMLVEVYADQWWHEVIALSAGQPSADANALVRGLLAQEKADEPASTATFVAARCVETATQLLTSVEQEVNRRLATIIPPRSVMHAKHLASLGHVAGPALLGALRTADAPGRALLCRLLVYVQYDLAANALGRLLGDPEVVPSVWSAYEFSLTGDRYLSVLVGRGDHLAYDPGSGPVARFAAAALFAMAAWSEHARLVLEKSLSEAHISVHDYFCQLTNWRDVMDLHTSLFVEALVARIKSRAPEKPAPKRAARSG